MHRAFSFNISVMDLVVLRCYDNYVAANMAKNLLESKDIISFLQDEFISTIMPLWNIANGGIKLLVHCDDRPEAEAILQEADLQQEQDL